MTVNNIFLIENDTFFALSFMKRLQKFQDVKIHHYESFEEAFDEIGNTKPEIIFLDHLLGGINGVDALPIIKKVLPKTEVVIVSNIQDTSVYDRAMENGATKYFSKDALLIHNADGFIKNALESSTSYSKFWSQFLNSYVGTFSDTK